MPLVSQSLRFLYLVCTATLLSACGGPSPVKNAPADSPSVTASPGVLVDSTGQVFDLEALVDLRANKVRDRLGKPLSDRQENINEQMRTMTYKRGGYRLFVDYEVQSQRLLLLQLMTGDKSLKKLDEYLRAGHVSQSGKHYKLSPINEESGLSQGIDITPDSARVMDEFGHWVIQR